jgi:hypothetical protein
MQQHVATSSASGPVANQHIGVVPTGHDASNPETWYASPSNQQRVRHVNVSPEQDVADVHVKQAAPPAAGTARRDDDSPERRRQQVSPQAAGAPQSVHPPDDVVNESMSGQQSSIADSAAVMKARPAPGGCGLRGRGGIQNRAHKYTLNQATPYEASYMPGTAHAHWGPQRLTP